MHVTQLIILFLFVGAALAGEDLEFDNHNNDTDTALIRGLIKPTTTTLISSEIAAQIQALPFKDGDAFTKGDVLVKFDCSLFRARYAVAQAEYEAGLKDLENKQHLMKLDAVSNIDVDLSAIEVKRLKSSLRVAGVMVNRCVIKAPYNGRVIDTQVNQYESVAQDQELLSILDDKNLEIEIIVPSKWLVWLKEGVSFQFAVDETEAMHNAKVKKIGAVVDPVSQTILVKGLIEQPTNLLAGMSGTAHFEPRE